MTVPLALPAILSALLALGATAASAQEAVEQSAGAPVSAAVVARGLDHPWGIDFLDDGAMIVTERPGLMRIVVDGNISAPLDGVPEVWAKGQGGLLDVTVAPDFATSKRIFFSYSEPGQGGAGTAIARARLVREGAGGRLEEVETIFSMDKKSSTRQHFGSRIVFRPDGTLFFTIGDRGRGPRAQDFRDHAGAVLRIKQDGSIPADNPSPDGSKWLPELWSKGHRNPQSAAIDPATGELWTVEHGAQGGDELNRPKAGLNYGWPEISYGRDYSGARIGRGTSAQGLEQPVYYWDPSIAPSGLAIYDGNMFPEWRGDFLVGALKFQMLVRLDRDENGKIVNEERLFEREFGRIRDVSVAPDGAVVLITDEADGAIIRLSRGD